MENFRALKYEGNNNKENNWHLWFENIANLVKAILVFTFFCQISITLNNWRQVMDKSISPTPYLNPLPNRRKCIDRLRFWHTWACIRKKAKKYHITCNFDKVLTLSFYHAVKPLVWNVYLILLWQYSTVNL